MNTKLTPFRLTPEDLVLLDACQEHIGVRSRSEAIRAVLKAFARSEGVVYVGAHGHVLTSGHAVEKVLKKAKKARKVAAK
jgi:hypothetical protein